MSAHDIPLRVMPEDFGWTPCQRCKAIRNMCEGCVQAIEAALVVELDTETELNERLHRDSDPSPADLPVTDRAL